MKIKLQVEKLYCFSIINRIELWTITLNLVYPTSTIPGMRDLYINLIYSFIYMHKLFTCFRTFHNFFQRSYEQLWVYKKLWISPMHPPDIKIPPCKTSDQREVDWVQWSGGLFQKKVAAELISSAGSCSEINLYIAWGKYFENIMWV